MPEPPEEVFFLSNGRVAFEHAWIVLKQTQQTRQSTLGEYHPDFPSPHGPVQYYHGTTVAPASRIKTEGLKPAEPWYNRKYGGNHPKGIYGADDLEEASDYASMRGQDRNQQGRVFGIRGGNPEIPTPMSNDGGIVRYDNPIPRQYITPVSMQKSQMLLWPKELNNYRDPDTGEPERKMPGQFKKPGAPGFTQLYLRYNPRISEYEKLGSARSYVALPNMERPGSRIGLNSTLNDPAISDQDKKKVSDLYDLRQEHNVIGTDVHEDTHVAMDMIGETSGNPYHNELPAHIAETLQFTRRPRETINPRDAVLQDLDSGMSPTEVAVKRGKQGAMMHQQVSGDGPDNGMFTTLGPQKFTYDEE